MERREKTNRNGTPDPDPSENPEPGKQVGNQEVPDLQRVTRRQPPQCLAIGGSDSGGGAGIQADLKAFHANGVYGTTVITSITAQNTVRVSRFWNLPPDLVQDQLAAVFEDFAIASAKTGALGSPEIVSTVADFWRSLKRPAPLVVDPVIMSSSGHPLLAAEAIECLRSELIPLASVVTPNRSEAEVLSGLPIGDRKAVLEAGRRILALGPRAVLIKGGHLEGPGFDPESAVDFLFQGDSVEELPSPRLRTRSTHGTGCTYSAAIAAWLGRGLPLRLAVARAKSYTLEAIRHGLAIGRGRGPTDHFWFLADRGDAAVGTDEPTAEDGGST